MLRLEFLLSIFHKVSKSSAYKNDNLKDIFSFNCFYIAFFCPLTNNFEHYYYPLPIRVCVKNCWQDKYHYLKFNTSGYQAGLLSSDRPYSKPADPKSFIAMLSKNFFCFKKTKQTETLIFWSWNAIYDYFFHYATAY